MGEAPARNCDKPHQCLLIPLFAVFMMDSYSILHAVAELYTYHTITLSIKAHQRLLPASMSVISTCILSDHSLTQTTSAL